MTRSAIAASLATISMAWPPSSCIVGRPSRTRARRSAGSCKQFCR